MYSTIALMAYFVSFYLFVIIWDLEMKGIAYAMNVAGLALCIGSQVTIRCILTELKGAMFFPTKETFEGWA